MIHLLLIIPYPGLRDKVEYVVAHRPESQRLNADIRVVTVGDTLDVPAGQYDATIARGYSALKTSAKYTQTPTIGLSISGYDVARAISECCETYHPKKITVCGFSGRMYEVKDICRLLKTNAEVYAPTNPEELPAILERAKAMGCDALIGGYSANILARQYNIPSVVIQTEEDAVLQVLGETLHTVDQIRQERIISQMYKTIVYSSEGGLLYVDPGGVIKVRNRVVHQMNGDISLMNQPLKRVLPYLHKMSLSAVANGQGETGRILTTSGTRVTVPVSCTPVIANNEASGIIFNLSDITMIQDLKSQVRRKLDERSFQARYTFDDIIYQSSITYNTIGNAKRYTDSDSNVIIVGETGAGKELFTQSIHNSSQRKSEPFVAINYAALPENLLGGELFRYMEGALTGISKGGKVGLFGLAHGETPFLDEIGEISLSIQNKFLEVLQEKQARRIGDNKVIGVNVHIISATNKSIGRLSKQGLLRRDLMYRLGVLRLFLSPLRMRENDVELLFLHLLNMHNRENRLPAPRLETGALATPHNYPLTGNIRELKNIIERTCVFKTGDCITKQNLQDVLCPPDLDRGPFPAPVHSLPDSLSLDEPERLRSALKQSGGSRTQTARILGMDRSTLWRKMKKYGLQQ